MQRQLRRRGISVAVDGNFGAQTMNGYAAWQRRLGYSGLDASGMPGETSLKRLAGTRFRVTRVVRQGARRACSGVTLNARTIAMLKAAGRLSTAAAASPDATKGSYTGPDSSSQATHAGGGAVDLAIRTALLGRTVKAYAQGVGFAAWYRNWPGNQHIHAVAISDPDMANETAFPGWFDAARAGRGLRAAQGRPERRRDRADDARAADLGAVQALPLSVRRGPDRLAIRAARCARSG